MIAQRPNTHNKPAVTAPTTAGTAAQQTAAAQVRAYLVNLGFPADTAASLASWAWSEIVNGKSFDEIALDITQQPAFKAEFPEIEARQKAGLPPISAAQILDYRQRAAEAARAAGLPKTFYDSKDDFARLISADVSLDEFMTRIKDAQIVAYQLPADVRAQFAGTLGIGDFTALAFDPTVAAPLLERKINEAQAITAAQRTGFGALTEAQRNAVVDAGMGFEQQQQAFAQVQNAQELYSALDAGEQGISKDEQIGAAFGGNLAAQQRIEARARRRKATFEGSAGFGASREGVSGLGAAS